MCDVVIHVLFCVGCVCVCLCVGVCGCESPSWLCVCLDSRPGGFVVSLVAAMLLCRRFGHLSLDTCLMDSILFARLYYYQCYYHYNYEQLVFVLLLVLLSLLL